MNTVLILIGAFVHLSISLFGHTSYKTSKQCEFKKNAVYIMYQEVSS